MARPEPVTVAGGEVWCGVTCPDGEHVESASRKTRGDVDAQPSKARLKRARQDLGVTTVTSGMESTPLKLFLQSVNPGLLFLVGCGFGVLNH